MEDKINISEVLKDCPKGMELDCTMFDGVYFDHVDDLRHNSIKCYVNNGNEHFEIALDEHGQYISNKSAKCVIFPKGKTSWEGFVPPCKFKDGDVIFVVNNKSDEDFHYESIAIFKEIKRNKDIYVHGLYSYNDDMFSTHPYLCEITNSTIIKFATEEQKEKLFNLIKINGYKWNPDNKTLEDLVDSKEDVDDEIVMSGIYFDRKYHADKVELHLGNYEIETIDGKTYAIFKNPETKILKPKFKVGDRIVKKNGVCVPILITKVSDEFYYSNTESSVGVLSISEQDEYELVKNKFDITSLVPFESRVLVRGSDPISEWKPAIFGTYRGDKYNKFYVVGGNCWKQCIPYEGNEHLMGTTNSCDEYFKTWK